MLWKQQLLIVPTATVFLEAYDMLVLEISKKEAWAKFTSHIKYTCIHEVRCGSVPLEVTVVFWSLSLESIILPLNILTQNPPIFTVSYASYPFPNKMNSFAWNCHCFSTFCWGNHFQKWKNIVNRLLHCTDIAFSIESQ